MYEADSPGPARSDDPVDSVRVARGGLEPSEEALTTGPTDRRSARRWELLLRRDGAGYDEHGHRNGERDPYRIDDLFVSHSPHFVTNSPPPHGSLAAGWIGRNQCSDFARITCGTATRRFGSRRQQGNHPAPGRPRHSPSPRSGVPATSGALASPRTRWPPRPRPTRGRGGVAISVGETPGQGLSRGYVISRAGSGLGSPVPKMSPTCSATHGRTRGKATAAATAPASTSRAFRSR